MGILVFNCFSNDINMKIFSVLSFGLCLTVAMGQDVVNEVGKKTIKTNTKAASTYQNCNCQCDSYTWSDGIYIRGNCRSKAKLPGQYTSATGLFCYVSGTALCSCRDVQRSQSVTDNYGRPRYYSFEACTTPPRRQCSNYGLQNYGDGDFPFCAAYGSGSGSNGGFGGGFGGSGSGSNGGFGSGFGGLGSGSYGSGSYGSESTSCRHPWCNNYGSNSGNSYRPNSPNRPNRPNYGNSNSNYGSNLPWRSSNSKDSDAVVFGDA